MWFCQKRNVNIGLYSDISRPISFKRSAVTETKKFDICLLVWMTLTFIQSFHTQLYDSMLLLDMMHKGK